MHWNLWKFHTHTGKTLNFSFETTFVRPHSLRSDFTRFSFSIQNLNKHWLLLLFYFKQFIYKFKLKSKFKFEKKILAITIFMCVETLFKTILKKKKNQNQHQQQSKRKQTQKSHQINAPSHRNNETQSNRTKRTRQLSPQTFPTNTCNDRNAKHHRSTLFIIESTPGELEPHYKYIKQVWHRRRSKSTYIHTYDKRDSLN